MSQMDISFLGLRRYLQDADDNLPTVRDRIYSINYSTSPSLCKA